MLQFVPFVALLTATLVIVTSTVHVLPIMLSLGLFILFAAMSSGEQESEYVEHYAEDNWRHW